MSAPVARRQRAASTTIHEQRTGATARIPTTAPVNARPGAALGLDEFRVAMSHGRIRPHARPVVDLDSGLTVGYQGRGDFRMDPAGRLVRRPEREVVPFVYAGAAILHPRLFKGAPADPFSLNLLFGQAMEGN